MNTEQVLQVLGNNIQESIGLEELRERLDEGKTLNLYWGCAPTRTPSIAYLVPLLKLRDCIRTRRINVTIFLADLHSYMDKGFTEVARVRERTAFYQYILTHMMRSLGVQDDEYKFVKGSDVQLTPQYMTNLLRFTTLVTGRDAQHAGKEVVKQNDKPTLSSMIYPLMQCLDEVALNADIQLGGLDQRKIFTFGRDFMPTLGFRKCVYMMNPLIPSLVKGGKMSSSDPKGKLEFTDTPEQMEEKIKRAFCSDGDTNLSTNPCLSLMKYIVFPLWDETIRREQLSQFHSYENFEEFWAKKSVLSQILKRIVFEKLVVMTEYVRNTLRSEEGQRLFADAYTD
jgi:tyrosyl-tRNA synthetase